MSSRNETLIKAVLDETNMENYTPLSRNEQFLKDIITKKDQCTLKPISRIEEMYFNLHQKIKENSGGGGGSLKTLLDATKSTYFLFFNYKGTSAVGLISYSDTSSVTNMCYMFGGCTSLTSIPQLDTSNATNIGYMFNNCNKLTTIDISHMNISDSSKNIYFASNCHSLTKLIIRNMGSIPTLNSNAFMNCYHFTGTIDATYNPQGLKDARIYVPDDKVSALKTATNWSVYADIIVPLSTLVE